MTPLNTWSGQLPDEIKQQTWTSSPSLFGAKEFDSGENVEPAGFFTVSFGFTGAANAAAGIILLPLPRLPLLPDEGAGDRCSHGQFGSTQSETSADEPDVGALSRSIKLGSMSGRSGTVKV